MDADLREDAIYRLSKSLLDRLHYSSILELSTELEDCILVEAASLVGLPRDELDGLPPLIIQERPGLINMYHVVLECFIYNLSQPSFNEPAWWNKVNVKNNASALDGGKAAPTFPAQIFFDHYRPRGGDTWVELATRQKLMQAYVPVPGLQNTPSAVRSAARAGGLMGLPQQAGDTGAGMMTGGMGAAQEGAEGQQALPPPHPMGYGAPEGTTLPLDFSFPSTQRPATLDAFARLYYLYGAHLSAAVHNLMTRTSLDCRPLLPSLALLNPAEAHKADPSLYASTVLGVSAVGGTGTGGIGGGSRIGFAVPPDHASATAEGAAEASQPAGKRARLEDGVVEGGEEEAQLGLAMEDLEGGVAQQAGAGAGAGVPMAVDEEEEEVDLGGGTV